MITDAAADGTPRATLLISGRPAIDLITPVTIGRDPRPGEGEVVVVDGDPLVSKAHLRIDRGAGGFVVIDLGSSNGTFLHQLGQERAVPTDSWTPLGPGAEVEFGDHRLTIDVQAVPQAPSRGDEVTPVRGIVAPVPPNDPWGAGRVAGALIACTNCGRGLEAGSRLCDGCGTPTVPVTSDALPMHPMPQGFAVPFDTGRPGAPVFVDLSGSSDSSGGRRKLVVAIVAALVAVVAIGVVVAMASGGDDDDGASVVTYSRIDADTYDLPAVTYDFLVYNFSGDESTTDDVVPSNG